VKDVTNLGIEESKQQIREDFWRAVKEVLKKVYPVLEHAIVMVLCIASMGLVEILLNVLLGKPGYNFYDKIPLKYVIHTSDLLIIGTFLYQSFFQKNNH
jgi:hypothetical protein